MGGGPPIIILPCCPILFANIFCIAANLLFANLGPVFGFNSSFFFSSFLGSSLGNSFFISSFSWISFGFISKLLVNSPIFGLFSTSAFGILFGGWGCSCSLFWTSGLVMIIWGSIIFLRFWVCWGASKRPTLGLISSSDFGTIIFAWNFCFGIFSIFGSSFLIFCSVFTWISIFSFICSWFTLASFCDNIFSFKAFINEGCCFSVWFSSDFFSFSSSLKNDNFCFSFTGSGLSSSLKNPKFGFCLGCSIFILFSFFGSSISLNRFILSLGFSCSKLKLVLAFTLILSLTLLFSIFGSSSSSKNGFLCLISFWLGSLSNKLKFDSFTLFDWVNKLTFLVISAVLSTIFEGSISSSSLLSNIFFNLFPAFSNCLLRFISIIGVSIWLWNKLDCICIGCCCWFFWFACSWTTCPSIWGGLIIWCCIIGIWRFWFIWCICSWAWGWGLGMSIIIIGWPWFWLIWGFSSIFWLFWGFACGGDIFWLGFLLKIFEPKSS